jgi:hypothetical protein
LRQRTVSTPRTSRSAADIELNKVQIHLLALKSTPPPWNE